MKYHMLIVGDRVRAGDEYSYDGEVWTPITNTYHGCGFAIGGKSALWRRPHIRILDVRPTSPFKENVTTDGTPASHLHVNTLTIYGPDMSEP